MSRIDEVFQLETSMDVAALHFSKIPWASSNFDVSHLATSKLVIFSHSQNVNAASLRLEVFHVEMSRDLSE